MNQVDYLEIAFQHFWHVGSGVHLNKTQQALKDQDGFPYISDQQIHGILKDICQQAEDFERITTGTTSNLFGGNGSPKWLEAKTAQLADKTKASIQSGDSTSRLYKTLPSNSQDEEGNTKEGHLRFIETVIPMTLYCPIMLNVDAKCSDDDYNTAIEEFKKALGGRHRIAHDKNSGFGRCTLKIIKVSKIQATEEKA